MYHTVNRRTRAGNCCRGVSRLKDRDRTVLPCRWVSMRAYASWSRIRECSSRSGTRQTSVVRGRSHGKKSEDPGRPYRLFFPTLDVLVPPYQHQDCRMRHDEVLALVVFDLDTRVAQEHG